ncbi:carbohydrate ABC transporter substrate-binding protein, CUT1 family [Rhizobiales bacterium GAS188]|nr:carbohydrate ABC transporter substrate-binding protein, CUT1 family [Rhizobiales bacterium GAS188]
MFGNLKRFAVAAVAGIAALLAPALATAQTELRIMWYSDGNEGEVLRDLLDRFEKQNSDIKVVLDRVPYKTVLENLPQILASGQGPDLARVTDLGGLSKFYLDISPYVKDKGYWEDNFKEVLPWVRPAGVKEGIYGLMTQLTLTIPLVNTTLFQQANVPLPGPKASWDDWATAAREVAKKVDAPYPIAIDRSGHRVGTLIIDRGGKLLDGDKPALIDDGFKAAMKTLYDWHQDGTMSKALWGSVGGTAYRGANEEFANGQVVLYYSGTWQIPQFAKTIGNGFDWQAMPNPCGPAACTGMPGGAALVPIKTTKHPEAVAKLMDYLASEPVYSEYHARTYFLPASIGLAKKGVPYKSDLPQVQKSLEIAVQEVAKTAPLAFAYQGFEHNRIMFNATIARLNQAISGEMTLDEAFKRMQADIVEGLAAKGIKL